MTTPKRLSPEGVDAALDVVEFGERLRVAEAKSAIRGHIAVLEAELELSRKGFDRGSPAEATIKMLEQHISELEKSLENARKERDEAMRETHAADVARATEQETSARLRRELDEAVADNAVLLLTLQSVVDSIDAHAAPLAGVGVTISFPPLVRFALAQHHPGVALLEEHRKALVRARNEGLEMAAIGVGHTPPCETGVVCASCAIARGIRAMKEPEPT